MRPLRNHTLHVYHSGTDLLHTRSHLQPAPKPVYWASPAAGTAAHTWCNRCLVSSGWNGGLGWHTALPMVHGEIKDHVHDTATEYLGRYLTTHQERFVVGDTAERGYIPASLGRCLQRGVSYGTTRSGSLCVTEHTSRGIHVKKNAVNTINRQAYISRPCECGIASVVRGMF